MVSYALKLGHQVLMVGHKKYWNHKPDCNIELITNGKTEKLEVLISEHLHPAFDYITTIHLEDSKFYVQSRS